MVVVVGDSGGSGSRFFGECVRKELGADLFACLVRKQYDADI